MRKRLTNTCIGQIFDVTFCAKIRTKAANKNLLVEAGVSNIKDQHMRVILYILIATFITACSSVQQIPAKERDIDKIFYSKASFKSTWSSVQHWMTSENIPISKIDREGGFIYAEYWPSNMSSIIDCGEIKGQMGFSSAKMQDINVKLTVLFLQLNDNIELSINVFGEGSIAIRDAMTDRQLSGSKKIHCVSTGVLESKLKNFLSKRSII
jgi:hypothetical protein